MTASVAVTTTLSITAYGTPTPQGSKQIVRGILVDANRARLRTWREDVKQAALEALDTNTSWDRDAVAVLGSFTFQFNRPKNHFVAGDPARPLKANAPRLHVQRPDLDKLLRSTWDALTDAGVVWDDCRIAQAFAAKVYVNGHDRPGATITLTAVKP